MALTIKQDFSDQITPSGLVNGVNTIFTLPVPPAPPDSLVLFRNGLLQKEGIDFFLLGSLVTFIFIPQIGDLLVAYYRTIGYDTTAPGSFFTDEIPSGVKNGINTTFNVVNTPNPVTNFTIAKNSVVLVSPGDYTLVGKTITLTVAPIASDFLAVAYTFYPVVPEVLGTDLSLTRQKYVDALNPTGSINGINTIFTLPSVPASGTLSLFRNGVEQASGVDYSISGGTITFINAGSIPQTGDSLTASYTEIGPSTSIVGIEIFEETPVGLINAVNRNYSLAHVPAPAESLKLIWNGATLELNVDYSLTSNVVTFLNFAPASGDALTASYRWYPTSLGRFNSVPKDSLISYIRFYLNDLNGKLWPDAVLRDLINKAEIQVTQELDAVWKKIPLNLVEGVGIVNVPANLKSITRITYKGFYVDMLTQTQVALLSPVYRTQISRPRWATFQFEGYFALRLFPVPDETLPALSDSITIYQDTNAQNECQLSGYFYSDFENPNLIIPDWMQTPTLRYYVLWKAFMMEGNGQDQKVAEYWKARWVGALKTSRSDLSKVYASKERQYTDVAIQRPYRKNRPILPPNFGTTVDYW